MRRRLTGAVAIESVQASAFPQVKLGVVGLAGLEPGTSSLSAIEGSALCGPAFSQVARDRKGRSNAFLATSFEAVQASWAILSPRLRADSSRPRCCPERASNGGPAATGSRQPPGEPAPGRRSSTVVAGRVGASIWLALGELTAYSCHRSQTPLSRRVPRSAKAKPAPATRSLTVREHGTC